MGILLMTGGGLLFLLPLIAWRHVFADQLEEPDFKADDQGAPPVFPWGSRQIVGLGLGIVGGIGAFLLNGHNAFTVLGAASWALGIVALLVGFWHPLPNLRVTSRRPSLRAAWLWPALALLFTLVLAAFLRFYKLDSIPGSLGGDHAGVVQDIKDIGDGKESVYFERNQGREPIFFYFSAALVPLFGYSFTLIKVTSVLISLLTIPAVYFMTRELFFKREVALLAAVLLAVAYWHLVFSRLGWPVILAPLFVTVTLLFLFRALKFNHTSDFLLCGLFLGMGLYTYGAFRVVPAAVGASLAISLLRRLAQRERLVGVFFLNALLLVLTSLVAFAPLARYWNDESDLYWDRFSNVTEQGDRSGIEGLAANAHETLLMFNFQGDDGGTGASWNVTGGPQLDFVTGALFLLGAASALVTWAAWRRGLGGHAALAFLVMLVPSVTSVRSAEVPNALRAIGAIPLVTAFAALPLYLAGSLISRTLGKAGAVVAVVLVGASLGLIGYLNYDHFFSDYSVYREQNTPNEREIASAIKEFTGSGGRLESAYILPRPDWLDYGALAIDAGDVEWQNWLSSVDEAAQHVASGDPKLYVLNQADQDSARRLKEIYPQGVLELVRSSIRPEYDFLVFRVPARG
jgi:hypothetical protein